MLIVTKYYFDAEDYDKLRAWVIKNGYKLSYIFGKATRSEYLRHRYSANKPLRIARRLGYDSGN